MGRAGRGRGGMVGDLPGQGGAFKPTMLPGQMTRGKILANILQKAAPQAGDEPDLDYVAGAFVEVRQDAEKALEKEEIPPASKEFVRQYFGAIEPERAASEAGRGR